MLAIDTNVIVRFLTKDHPAQSKAAKMVLASGVFVPLTVCLETEWVLRSAYKFSPEQVRRSLTLLFGLPTVTVEASDRVALELEWLAAGMDFADAVHLTSAEGCEAFVTFDQKLATTARDFTTVPVRSI